MISAGAISRTLSTAGYRVRTSAPMSQDAIRVRKDELCDRVTVRADYVQTRYAVTLAEQLAKVLREAGYTVDAEENTTFFYVTGRAS